MELPKGMRRQLDEMALRLRETAKQFPFADFSQEVHERHRMVFTWPGGPKPVSVLFTLDKDSLRGVGQPDHWHVSIIHDDNTTVSDELLTLLGDVFFPEGGYQITRPPNDHPSRHIWKDCSPDELAPQSN